MADPYRYWGKAKPAQEGAAPWHLLPYHSLDVAAVGITFLRRSPRLSQLFSERLQLPEPELLNWMGFWLALHDLGKFSTAFQGQRNDILHRLQERESKHGYFVRHDSLGFWFWREVLGDDALSDEWFGANSHALHSGVGYWVRAVTGHHGQPPAEVGDGGTYPHFIKPHDHQAISTFVADMRALFLSEVDFSGEGFQNDEAFESASQQLSWWVAGLAVLADWVGSNQDHFPYRSEAQPCATYWPQALAQAERACDDIGALPVASHKLLPFQGLFPQLTTPSPLQVWACDTALCDGPQIHLLEDVTGAGKTEAAMMLTHRLMSAGVADGFYIGLPTMATANAMYGRLSTLYAGLFDGTASLTLASGQRELVEAFAASILPSGQAEMDNAQVDETATARCMAWLADHNKRALLAPAGVGTIDQALMAVLQGKHQSLRMLGLFRKVLIVDEVHACDPYMQGVLERLLEAHAAVGGSAILLSATLPQGMKQALLDAFAKGAAGETVPPACEQGYPLVTSWAAAESLQLSQALVATRADVVRTLQTRYVSDVDEVVAGIRAALDAGRCVCWMRNTVADAMDAHARFAASIPPEDLLLFHARFSLRDRLDMEQRILANFGARSSADDRRGRLVIATQVAEQSLDADWDWVVSDLAPVDRLIQRAGRLQRHRRDAHGNRLADPSKPDGREPPCLWVLGPPWSDQPSATWFKDAFPKSSKVYRHHGQLWLTARLMQEGELRMPADARRLIEGVFGEDASLPSALQKQADHVEGEALSESSQAHCNSIRLASGYAWRGEQWWSDARTPTRLGEASASVLLCRWTDGRLVPWVEHANPRHAWAYSTVRVPERLIAEAIAPESAGELAEWERVKAALPDQGKWSVLLPLTQTAQGWIGEASGRRGEALLRRRWLYDRQFGLVEAPALSAS